LIEYVPDDAQAIKAHLSQMNQEINAAIKAETGYTTTVGVGDYKPSVAEASQSYAEAQLAVQVAHMRNKRNCTVFHNDLGIFKFLYDIHESVDGRDFVEETLRPLLEYDRQHQTEFYPTLAQIVEMDWNLHQASEMLHIHYNTAKYRFKRAEEILGLDCSAYQNKLKIELAICWKQIIHD
jgi:purine catabolism regulator